MRWIKLGLFFLIASIIGIGCQKDSPTVFNRPAEIIKGDNKIFIVDRTGKKWDVTHAVQVYGFKAEEFQYGLGPNAIPPLNNPQFLNPGDPGYPIAADETLIIGTRLHGDARAYPIFMMKTYEIANDRFDSTHVAVGYWPLIQLAAVYSREIDGKVLTLSASGWTYRDTFVLYDYETESLWYHLQGTDGLTSISGFYADRKLQEFRSSFIRWNQWFAENPDTKILKSP